MKHFASRTFWECLEDLPKETQRLARSNYELLKTDPYHPSLRFKKIGSRWSVRVGLHHRALGVEVDGGILWVWIGSHADYDHLVR